MFVYSPATAWQSKAAFYNTFMSTTTFGQVEKGVWIWEELEEGSEHDQDTLYKIQKNDLHVIMYALNILMSWYTQLCAQNQFSVSHSLCPSSQDPVK